MFSRARMDENQEPTDLSAYKRDMIASFACTYVKAQYHLQQYYDKMLLQAAQKKKVVFQPGQDVWVYQPEAQQKDGVKKKSFPISGTRW